MDIKFAVRENVNFYRIELSKTLLHFAEFDFTYFWEQCIEAGKAGRKTGRLPQQIVTAAKNIIGKAHPYIEACIGTDYSEIVLDCIIEYICHSERIGLEELWARCISPKNPYESAIFRRVSEYKTNRAMNRWTSIVRIQEYAKNKIAFIFDRSEGSPALTDDIIRTRKEYFDLSLSVAANELCCPTDALPSVRICSPSTLPNAAFAVGKVAKSIYRQFSESLADGRDMSALENRDCSGIRDQLAMEAYSYVKGMTRPNDIEMNFALETICETPRALYLPDSLKAAVDLEFDMMLQNKIYLRRCENCGRFFYAPDDNPRCDRVNSSGKTCRKQYEELVAAITAEAGNAVPEAAEVPELPEGTVAPEPEPVVKIAPEVGAIPIPPPEKHEPVEVPKETEKRAQKLYNSLYKRVGKGIDENEFKEWSAYLSNMKRNLKLGEATLRQYEEFLDYSDRLNEEVKVASRNKTVHAPVEKTYEHNDTKPEKAAGNDDDDEFVDIARLSERIEKKSAPAPHVPQVDSSVVSSGSVAVKPFVPQAFDTLFDAVSAGEDSAPGKKPAEVKEVKKPKWERLTREEAFKDSNDDDE